MEIKLNNTNREPLLEISLTLHPQALWGILLGGNGLCWLLPRLALPTLAAYLVVTLQIHLPYYYPELWLNPLLGITTFLACRKRPILAMLAALLGGIALDAAYGLLPGPNAMATILATGGALLLQQWAFFPGESPWLAAAISGGLAHLIQTLILITLFGGAMPWSQRLDAFINAGILGTAVNALALTPVIHFLADWSNRLFQWIILWLAKLLGAEAEKSSNTPPAQEPPSPPMATVDMPTPPPPQ